MVIHGICTYFLLFCFCFDTQSGAAPSIEKRKQKHKQNSTSWREREYDSSTAGRQGELLCERKEKGRGKKKNAAHFLSQTDNEPPRRSTPTHWTRLIAVLLVGQA